ncbi:MAG: M48 family metalloprotease, partial [Wenzhouxiangellaceae bacterium]|nr:M48 family metalloprotease [Wenzhouxiangellaceae bacterium]
MRRIAERLSWAALAAVLALQPVAALAQQAPRLPDLGSSGEVLPPEEERQFPREFERYVRAQGVLVDDPLVVDWLREMGYRLAHLSEGRDREFHFHVLRVPGINAFAAPAGVVAMNAGLILAAETEDEVAGVVAHEISHVTQNHLKRGMEEAQRVSLPVMLATMGLVLAGGMSGAMDARTASGILATGSGLSQQAQINYTRQNEAEADRIGIQLMYRAGYDPRGMADFFETLRRWARSQGDGPPEYLRTHPLTVSRVAEARQRVDQLPAVPDRGDDRFEFIRARLRVIMAQHADEAVQQFLARLESRTGDEAANRYGLALALVRARLPERAAPHVRWLLERDPDSQMFRLLEADRLLAEDRIDDALEVLEQLHRDFGSSDAVSRELVRALLRTERAENARRAADLARELVRRTPHDPELTRLLARSADLAGD